MRLLFFAVLYFSLIGCERGKSELSAAETVKPETVKEEPSGLPEITYYGEIKDFGIGFLERPNFIQTDGKLSIESLIEGGYVLMMRHTLRDPSEGKRLWDFDREGTCMKGTSLNEIGIKQAKHIRTVIDELNIPIGEIFASPTCRTKQLAELAFGANYVEKIELIYQPMMKLFEKSLFDMELVRLLSEPIVDGTNRVLTGHNNTIERLGIRGVPKVRLEQGDTAVFKPLGDNKFHYIGTILIEEWEKQK